MASASICTCPARRTPDANHSTDKPCVRICSSPCAWTVFHGAPRPASRAAGHCDWPSTTVIVSRPQPGTRRRRCGCGEQQSERSASVGAPASQPHDQKTRPGSGTAWLSDMFCPTCNRPSPLHTVPRGSSICKRAPLAACSSPANQTAGACSSSPSKAPASAPAMAHMRIMAQEAE